ncbi:hypothetical protein CDAR_585741 [Caerostris darwini]|uniref:Uncharacterized protein n=1 Tax=Caerostris darwini TaxID=1538125 RepID=A0AAV4TLR8_9ARAC|nr:hypothetical protein CDAR_585741 [Caerostris darwini]
MHCNFIIFALTHKHLLGNKKLSRITRCTLDTSLTKCKCIRATTICFGSEQSLETEEEKKVSAGQQSISEQKMFHSGIYSGTNKCSEALTTPNDRLVQHLQRRKLHHKGNSSGPASSWARGQSSTPVPQVVRLGEKGNYIILYHTRGLESVNDLAVPFSSLVRLFNRSGGKGSVAQRCACLFVSI